MKSFKEEVEEIKNAKVSMQSKKEALVKLGLHKYEIEFVLGESKEAKRSSFTFGVEIECLIDRGAITSKLYENNVKFQYEGYNHTDNKSYFKFVTDASIHGENPIECVSPVLSGKKGMSDLRKCCKALNDAGAQVNKSTGLHVHIGAESLTDEAYINVFKNYKKLEILIDSFMANSRRENNSQWCRSLRDHFFDFCHTKENIKRELCCDRYHKVNAESYQRHHTIEFRQHQGTIDFEKISNWVNFCAKLVEYSKTNIIERCDSIDDIPFLSDSEKRFFNQRRAALN